jgi:hypothetical protein
MDTTTDGDINYIKKNTFQSVEISKDILASLSQGLEPNNIKLICKFRLYFSHQI